MTRWCGSFHRSTCPRNKSTRAATFWPKPCGRWRMRTDRPSRTARFQSDAPPRSGARNSARKVVGGSAKSTEPRRRHLTNLLDITPEDTEEILAISADLKERMKRGDRP